MSGGELSHALISLRMASPRVGRMKSLLRTNRGRETALRHKIGHPANLQGLISSSNY